MLPFIIERDGRVDRWTILSGRSLSLQNGNSKKDNQQTVKNKEYLMRKLASIFLAKKKSLVVKNSCKSVLKGNSCDEKLNKKSILFYSRSPDVGVIADFIEDFSNAVSVWLHKLN